MSLSSYCNAIQEEQAKIIRNREIEIKHLMYEIKKKDETIKQLRKANSQILKDYEFMRDNYFELKENNNNK